MEYNNLYKLVLHFESNTRADRKVMPSRKFPKVMSEEDLIKLLEAVDQSSHYNSPVGDFIKARDKTIIKILNYCGLRPSECMMLKWSDIDFERRLIYIKPYMNKVRCDEPAVLTKPAIEVLENYARRLQELNISSPYLFPSLWTQEPIQAHSFAKTFVAYMKKAGIAVVEYYTTSGKPCYNYRPYTGRHNYLTKVYEKTEDIEAVKTLARHKNISSSDVYIHISESHKLKIADKVFG